jgi:hypothetical protein
MAQTTKAGPLVTTALSAVQTPQAQLPQAMLNFVSLVVTARMNAASFRQMIGKRDAQ